MSSQHCLDISRLVCALGSIRGMSASLDCHWDSIDGYLEHCVLC